METNSNPSAQSELVKETLFVFLFPPDILRRIFSHVTYRDLESISAIGIGLMVFCDIQMFIWQNVIKLYFLNSITISIKIRSIYVKTSRNRLYHKPACLDFLQTEVQSTLKGFTVVACLITVISMTRL